MRKTPNHFHFIFGLQPQTSPFHVVHYLCLESCLQINQPEQISFYYAYEPFGTWWEKIRPKLSLKKVEPETFVIDNPLYGQTQEGQFIQAHQLEYAHQSDFLRLKILLEQGGVYADIDTLFVNPLPEDLFEQAFVLGAENPIRASEGEPLEDSLCNAFIMSEPGAAFGRQWLNHMYQVFDGTWSRHSCLEAGRLSKTMPEAIHICPQHFFYKHPSTPKGVQTLLLGRDYDTTRMYSMHLWAHLWWDKRRRDYTNFHAGLLTEAFIKTVDTTYTNAARRFLA
ncbi:MAG: glycosyl transferase [Anaerolineae bacterium]|nr:glycosyl transferase [Anaerolineae bacterium]